MARQPIDPLYKSYRASPSLRAVARPVDTFVQYQAEDTSGLTKLAKALSSVEPSLDNFFLAKQEEDIRDAEAEGTKLAFENNRKSWKEVITAHPELEGANPHLRRSYNLSVARQRAREMRDSMVDFYMQNPGLRETDDPGKFSSTLKEFIGKWTKENMQDMDPDVFAEGFMPMAESYVEQISQSHVAWRQDAYRNGIKSTFSQEIAGLLDDAVVSPAFFQEGTRGQLFESVGANIEALIENLGQDTLMSRTEINQLVAQSIATTAQSMGPEGLVLMEHLLDPKQGVLKGGTGALGGIPEIRGIVDSASNQIARQYMQMEDFQYRQQERQRDQALRTSLTSLATQLFENPTADPTKAIAGIMSMDWRAGQQAMGLVTTMRNFGNSWSGDPVIAGQMAIRAYQGKLTADENLYALRTRQIDLGQFMVNLRAIEAQSGAGENGKDSDLDQAMRSGLGYVEKLFPVVDLVGNRTPGGDQRYATASGMLITQLMDFRKTEEGQKMSSWELQKKAMEFATEMSSSPFFNTDEPDKSVVGTVPTKSVEELGLYQRPWNVERVLETATDGASIPYEQELVLGDEVTYAESFSQYFSNPDHPDVLVNKISDKIGITPEDFLMAQAKLIGPTAEAQAKALLYPDAVIDDSLPPEEEETVEIPEETPAPQPDAVLPLPTQPFSIEIGDGEEMGAKGDVVVDMSPYMDGLPEALEEALTNMELPENVRSWIIERITPDEDKFAK